MQDFHQLIVWRKAHSLVLRVYQAYNQLPASENLGLASNLRRSAVNIPRAIAEGAGRESSRDFALDLGRARAAAYELEYILLLCRDLGFFSPELHDELFNELVEVRKMISGLLAKVGAPAEPLR